MELGINLALALAGVLITLLVFFRQKALERALQETASRLAQLESGREAQLRQGLQMEETYATVKQMVQGLSAIQGQLSDMGMSQRQAGESVTELKSLLPGQLETGLQKVIGTLIEQASGEKTAAEQRFAALKEGLQQTQIEFMERTSKEAVLRHQDLDLKLASYRQEVESRLSANVQSVQNLLQAIERRFTELAQGNNEAIAGIRQSVGQQLKEMRDESAQHRSEVTSLTQKAGAALEGKVSKLTEDNNANLEKLKMAVEQRLQALQTDNAAKLEEMRKTVDEKLHATLEQRLGESFKLVSERLEQVHRGLGEMQTLASGVGDLKRVLTNVKTRGTWGEMQLHQLLEQLLTAEQYVANTPTRPGSNDRVEFAIRLPGKEDDEFVLLPIDAKFPVEDYQRLLQAQEQADTTAVEEASRAIELRLKAEAKTIFDKYVCPPHTTDFALLYLPIEGLYAEVLRRPGLTDALQRQYRVNVAGPTTLTAILNSLQMGFRTLAITKRASDVWNVLGAVKTEFGKFGDIVEATKKKLEAASKQFDQVDVRTRAIQRQLRQVEALPAPETDKLIGLALAEESGEADSATTAGA